VTFLIGRKKKVG